jgi:hypothetical protein
VAGDLYWSSKKIGLTERSIKRQIEGSRDWLGLHNREKKEKGCKRNRGAKAFNVKGCSIDRKGIGIMVFQARRRDKEPFLFIEKAIEIKFTWLAVPFCEKIAK